MDQKAVIERLNIAKAKGIFTVEKTGLEKQKK